MKKKKKESSECFINLISAPVKRHQQKLKSVDNYSVTKSNVNVDKKTRSFLASLSATVPIQSCHPEAKVYRDNYKNNKEDLCKYLFKLYNKEVFEGKVKIRLFVKFFELKINREY